MVDSSLHIETERLLLRPPVLADLVPWAAMMQDAEAAKFIGGVQPRAQWLARRAAGLPPSTGKSTDNRGQQ